MTRTEPRIDSTPEPPSAPDSVDEAKQDWGGLVGLIGLMVAIALLGGLSWVIVVVAIVFMIFMHELGHFVTARLTGMKATELFVGFGPRVWSFRRGETEYGVKAIPAGAYVRIIGMNSLDEVAPADEPRAYRNKSYPRRLLVAGAGSAMHFVMALVLLFMLFAYYGEPLDREEAALTSQDWSLSAISVDSAAEAAGLEPGDRLISVDGIELTTFAGFGDVVVTRGGEEVEVVYERDGETRVTTAVIGERLTAEGAEGVFPLIEGDRILTVDDVDVDTYAEFSSLVADRLGEELEIIFVDAGTGEPAKFEGAVVTELTDPDVATTGFFGVSPDYARDPLPVIDAAGRSASEFGDFAYQSIAALGRFFTPGSLSDFVSGTFGDGGDATAASSAREVEARRLDASNPDENRILSIYGAARIGASATDQSFEGLFEFLVLLNIFVGVFNRVPLLPLDGGHLAVATYERIRSAGGRRYHADATKLLPLTYAVFFVLVTIGLLALARDIVDPIELG
ncbi:MAG: RIP metalloprotease [Acidimicrobiales bacterium]